jgi:hypothetical protein
LTCGETLFFGESYPQCLPVIHGAVSKRWITGRFLLIHRAILWNNGDASVDNLSKNVEKLSNTSLRQIPVEKATKTVDKPVKMGEKPPPFVDEAVDKKGMGTLFCWIKTDFRWRTAQTTCTTWPRVWINTANLWKNRVLHLREQTLPEIRLYCTQEECSAATLTNVNRRFKCAREWNFYMSGKCSNFPPPI